MKYVRRLLWFAATRLLMVVVIVALLTMAFYMCMNASNIYILLEDGMELRAQAILTREGADELPNFFRDEFLSADQALNIGLSDQSPYMDYNITGFDHVISMEWVWSWPWENTAEAVIVERVPRIDGKVVSSKSAQVKEGTLSANPPSWQGGRYRVKLYRAGGRWKIASLTQTQIIIEPTPAPTAAPTATPAAG